MSDDVDTEEVGDDGGSGKKKMSGKKIVMLALPILLLGGGAGAYFMGVFGSDASPEQVAAEEAAAPTQVIFYDLPEILVNLNSKGRRPNFLKLRVSLELTNDADVARLDEIKPRIMDNFQVYLRELRSDDLQGSAGIYRLREELLARVNATAQPAQIKDVLFKEVLVQ